MWAIGTEKDIEVFRDRRALVSVYISDGYNHDEIQWVLDSWKGFNRDASHNWHLLIPCKTDAYVLNQKIDAAQYDTELADKIVAQSNLQEEKFPLLVFESFERGNPPKFVSLHGMTRAKTISLLKEIAAIVQDEAEKGPSAPDEFRRKVMDRVDILSTQKKVLGFALKAVAIGGTAIGIISGVVGLI